MLRSERLEHDSDRPSLEDADRHRATALGRYNYGVLEKLHSQFTHVHSVLVEVGEPLGWVENDLHVNICITANRERANKRDTKILSSSPPESD